MDSLLAQADHKLNTAEWIQMSILVQSQYETKEVGTECDTGKIVIWQFGDLILVTLLARKSEERLCDEVA